MPSLQIFALLSFALAASVNCFSLLEPQIGRKFSAGNTTPTVFHNTIANDISHLTKTPLHARGGRSTISPLKIAASESSANQALVPPWVTTGILIFLWYAASIVCNQTSKVLLSTSQLGVQGLTLTQFIISALVGAVNLFALPGTKYEPIHSSAQLRDTALLAGVTIAGFSLFNACMSVMHVSLVMVLRAVEPFTTLLLSAMLLPISQLPPFRRACMLVPVIAGAALSSVGAHGPTTLGIILAVMANVCLGMRGILSKRLGAANKTDAFSEFFHICLFGAGIQSVIIGASHLALGTALPIVPPVESMSTLLMCGTTFFAYVQMSWVCLGRMSVVSHSLVNSLRRPATIVAALAYAPVTLSPLNIAGITLSCVGGLLYGIV